MLKFLTNKLKNHTINDEPTLYVNPPNHQYKDNEEHDSGTESDDEQQINLEELEEIVMENETLDRSSGSTTSPGPTICSVPSPYFLDSALASDSDINNDHHSSEEELEVINSSPKAPVQSRNASRCGNASVNLRSASVNALPEKRKWSEINLTNLGSVGKLNRLCLTPGTRIDQSSGSSDDEVQGFLAANMGTPVKFRTSPPVDVVKPGKSLSPPPKLFHYEVSSRKRHRHMHKPHHLQRPCLDFEKMQQLIQQVAKLIRFSRKVVTVLGRNIADSKAKRNQERIIQVRPKSEKFRTVASNKTSEPSSSALIQKNLDDYIYSLSNFELKQKLESCPGNLVDCPLLNGFREGLKKSISNHVNITGDNENRHCKSSRMPSAKKEKENSKTSKQESNVSEGKKQPAIKEVKATPSNTSRGVIRSTRAQDLRSQSNRDLLKPKTTNEKTRTSPYVTALPLKKKKSCVNLSTGTVSIARSNTAKSEDKKKPSSRNGKESKSPYSKGKVKKEKCSSAGNDFSLLRQKTQEIINPKFLKKKNSSTNTAAGDREPPQLKKSNTFFICKGTKNGAGDHKSKEEPDKSCWNAENDSPSEGNITDDDLPSPKLKPLTHNDSFCLIVKSSQNWSQKNRSDDEKWFHYGLAYEEKGKKTDKGILKNSNRNLKSVDSLEKIDSEKIVRFSDEHLRNKKVLKKLVRRKKRLQNFVTPAWYQKNKLFQKYLEILREKSALLSDPRETPPERLKPFTVPMPFKERYEPETFGLHPRRGKFTKSHTKDAYSY